MLHDVVYILKNDISSDELRYSLRSVCMNFPYRKIVFVGGCPSDIYPDIYIEDIQVGSTKWQRSTHSLIKALENADLTDDVWLFNDDFFVMDIVKPHTDVNYFNGTLEKRIIDLRRKNPMGSNYIGNLERLKGRLMRKGKDTLSFALHLPMLINREKALELLRSGDPAVSMFRSYYGNFYEIDCQFMKDVKVYDMETIPDTPFISTSDVSFKQGKVGEFLRKYFVKPCKYEKPEAERLREELRENYTEEGEIRYEQ